ncbi:hypothetical protein KIH74_11995 [Kineosporia sp. J2-2]|uniref:Uncharacterized protein n=1 Tax=Kineosporia corallincola TaxID=2835133 RepID=A0ABS5TGY1_9ACTN|nr:hypothetical protein [Kineosporia corallincola]MBT0769649.1 hypothetical protein [Kineosporia corallincola]
MTRRNAGNLVSTPSVRGAGPQRRPRGAERGLAPDPGQEAHFDPRLELAEHLLHRTLTTDRPDQPHLLAQVRNLLDDARHDQTHGSGDDAWPALLDLDRLLLDLTDGCAGHRARRIMEARQLLHLVREETTRARRHDESRLRRLSGILTALERRSADAQA